MRHIPRFMTAFSLYAVAAVVLLYHRGLLSGTNYLGNGGDPSLYIWMFRFLPKAIAHLQNPFVLKEAWAPVGLNITAATTTPLLALLAWPITALAGPIVAFNVVSIATPALAATSGYVFAGAFTKRWGVALVAGWIFGFSTYVFAALLGHLQTDFIAFVPLAFFAVVQRAAGKLSFVGFVLVLTVVISAQFLISLETFVTEAIFLFIFTVVTEASQSGGIARLIRLRTNNLIFGLVVAYMVVVVVMAPFIYSFFFAYGQMPHTLQNGGYWANDLLDFVIPTPVTWLGGHLAMPIAQQYTGNWSEDLGYIGIPLLLLTIFASLRTRYDKRAWPLLAVLGCGFVLTLGPRLHVLGRLTIKLPWALMEKLPLLGNAEPGRLMVFVLLGISGVCALWVDGIERRRETALSLLAVAAAFTLPASLFRPAGWWHERVPTAQLFGTGAYRRIIRQNENVLFLPFRNANGKAMFWQTETDGYFRMTNGYGDFIPIALNGWPAVRMLVAGSPGPHFARQFDLFTRATDIRKIIVPPPLLPVWRRALERGGWQPQAVGHLTVFAELSRVRADTPLVSRAEARYKFEAAHLAALRSAAVCMIAKNANQLYPASAITAHCLVPGFGPAVGNSRSNWDRLDGWLGFFDKGVGIGLNTNAATAARLVASTGAKAETIYFPYPQHFHKGGNPDRRGQLLEVFSKQNIEKLAFESETKH